MAYTIRTCIIFDAFNVSFKILCGLVAAFMVGFWAHEFVKNEDISAIDYKYLKSLDDGIYPQMSICISNPFLVDKFKNPGTNVSIQEYIDYIRGTRSFDERYNDIDFFDVTLDISEYLEQVFMRETDGMTLINYNCTIRKDCQKILRMSNNFNGIIAGDINRCFGMEIERKAANTMLEIGVSFKTSLADILTQMKNASTVSNYFLEVSTSFAYPKQFLRTTDQYNLIWRMENGQKMGEWIIMSSIEVLKRRNKMSDPCVEDWMHYDDLVLNRHISSVECESPYQRQNNKLCTTKREMKNSQYEVDVVKAKYLPPPCQEITDVKYKTNKLLNLPDRVPIISVIYPNLMKLISQNQSVNVHALIGNIGGYIGLFLGTIKRGVRIRSFCFLFILHSNFKITANLLIHHQLYFRICNHPVARDAKINVSVCKG